MDMTRRNLAAAGVLALGASALAGAAMADAADEATVTKNIDAFRKAILDADKATLEALSAEQLSYGHSDGRVQNKAVFVDGVMTRKAKVKSLTFPDLTVAVTGDAAVARHQYVSESELDGKASAIKLGTLEVWQKQNGSWKLLARQGFKVG
jgi:ketosteroid isomerase-like protein